MKYKIALLSISILLTMSVLVGATFAWFSDSATSKRNTFKSGTVDIEVCRDLDKPIPGPMFYTDDAECHQSNCTPDKSESPESCESHETGLWVPGKSVTRRLYVRNVGTIAIRLNQVKAEITAINVADPTKKTVLAADFAQSFKVKIYVADHNETDCKETDCKEEDCKAAGNKKSDHPELVLYNGSMADLLAGPTCIYKPTMAASVGGKIPVLQLCYEVTMSEDAGNQLQGIKPIVTFFVGAEQMTNIP